METMFFRLTPIDSRAVSMITVAIVNMVIIPAQLWVYVYIITTAVKLAWN